MCLLPCNEVAEIGHCAAPRSSSSMPLLPSAVPAVGCRCFRFCRCLRRCRMALLPSAVPAVSFRCFCFFRCCRRCRMAERVGFEPTRPFRAYPLSRRAPSSTRSPLRAMRSVNGSHGRDRLPYRLKLSKIPAAVPAVRSRWLPFAVVSAVSCRRFRFFRCFCCCRMAVRVGFEPTRPLRAYSLSRRARSSSSATSPRKLRCALYVLLDAREAGRVFGLAPPARVERATFNLGGCCSIHLSYGGAGGSGRRAPDPSIVATTAPHAARSRSEKRVVRRPRLERGTSASAGRRSIH